MTSILQLIIINGACEHRKFDGIWNVWRQTFYFNIIFIFSSGSFNFSLIKTKNILESFLKNWKSFLTKLDFRNTVEISREKVRTIP